MVAFLLIVQWLSVEPVFGDQTSPDQAISDKEIRLRDILGDTTYDIATKGIDPPDQAAMADVRKVIQSQNQELRKTLLDASPFSPSEHADGSYQSKRIFIFISSAMPDQVIRNYLAASAPILNETVLLLRGFVGGISRIKPTLNYISRILCGESPAGSSDCLTGVIDINPALFRDLGIDRVPAVAYLPDGPASSGCDATESSGQPEGIISHGDASLPWHLDKIQKAANDRNLKSLIRKLGGSYYDHDSIESEGNGTHR